MGDLVIAILFAISVLLWFIGSFMGVGRKAQMCGNCKHCCCVYGTYGRRGYYYCQEFKKKLDFVGYGECFRLDECIEKHGEAEPLPDKNDHDASS